LDLLNGRKSEKAHDGHIGCTVSGAHPRAYEEAVMTQRLSLFLLALVCSIASAAAIAASQPVISGSINGFEICPESVCGKAYFAGRFAGQVGNFRNTSGSFSVALTHDSLNETDGATTLITGGEWLIVIKQGNRAFSGAVQPGGTLIYHSESNTFDVALTLLLTQGGSGTVSFQGTLDHNDFPPSIVGTLFQ
jgi:hypothetical protein